MLRAIQTAGSKPPLFFVHGLHGIMSFSRQLVRALGPEQPLYGLNARGFCGTKPPYGSVAEMARDYVAEVRAARPSGPYLFGGMCAGGITAIEMARLLIAEGAEVGKVLLLDPPTVPFGYAERYDRVDPRLEPRVAQQMYVHVRESLNILASRYDDLPFDVCDARQLHIATIVGIESSAAFHRHRPAPFTGATEFILCAESAAAHFQPELPWQSILLGPRTIHVLPGNHHELFRPDRDEVIGLIKLYIEGALGPRQPEQRKSA